MNPIYRNVVLQALSLGLGLGVLFGSIAACSSSSSSTDDSVAAKSSSPTVVGGLYVAENAGDIRVLDLQDDTHYVLARQDSTTASEPESGVYMIDNGTLTLTDDKTHTSQVFTFSVTGDKSNGSGGGGGLLKTQAAGAGQQLVTPGQELLKKLTLHSGDGGTSQDFNQAAGPSFEGQERDTMGGKLRGVQCAGPMSGTSGDKLCWKLIG